MKEEIISLVDDDDQVIGQAPRKEVHQKGLGRHRVASVLVFNQSGELLIQKRSATVTLYPNCWTVSSAGHVAHGDDYLNTAVRELKEEVGITVTEKELELMGKLNIPLPSDDEMWQVYKYVTSQNNFDLQREEVSDVKFVSLVELKKMVEDTNSEVCKRARRLFNHFLFN